MIRSASIAGALLLGAALSLAEEPSGQRIPITDPDRLAALGFPRDARNVYRWSGAASGVSTSAAAIQTPETWGTATSFTTRLRRASAPSI